MIGRRYRIRSKGRFSFFLIFSLFLLCFGFMTVFGRSEADGRSKERYERVTVRSGDTVWAIAASYCSNAEDLRRYVYDISQLNELDGSYLTAGDQLLIPIRE